MNGLRIWRDSLSRGGTCGKVVLCGDILLGDSPTICLHPEPPPPYDTQAPYHASKTLPHTKLNADVSKKSPGVCRGDGRRPFCGFGFLQKIKEDIRRCLASLLPLTPP